MKTTLEWSVNQTSEGFEARTPYRQIVYLAPTEHEAIGSMLYGVARLAREGCMDPDNPHRKGVAPIQQAMLVLEQELSRQLEGRREVIDFEPSITSLLGTHDFTRRNEVISGVATAIAALARIKEL